MQLLQRSMAGTVLILAVIAVRTAAVTRLPKNTFFILWGMTLLQLLFPWRIPSAFGGHLRLPQVVVWQSEESRQFGHTEKDGMVVDREQTVTAAGMWQNVWFGGHYVKIVWAIGCGCCLLFYAFVYIRCRMHFLTSVCVKNAFVDEWLQQHYTRRKIQVRQSDFAKTPLTYGLFHPVILIPEFACKVNTKQLEYLLMHEWIHIRRFDIVTKFVLTGALAIHWFNPMVWVMHHLCSRDLELACDETVIRMLGEDQRSDYARMLIHMEESKSEMMPFCSNFSGSAIQERITAIMKYKKKSVCTKMLAVAAVSILTGVFVLCASVFTEQKSSQTEGAVQENSAVDLVNISLNLDNHRAEEIADKLITYIKNTYAGIYEPENFTVTFRNETIRGDKLYFDIEVAANMFPAEIMNSNNLQENRPAYPAPEKEKSGFLYQVHMPAANVADGENEMQYELFDLGEDGLLTPVEVDVVHETEYLQGKGD